ncbi:hypothetical protein BBJ28_00015039 [Nothophytophthora sp. Chile5]|nr:hypothetical protein BBJ28_00015039 [Nothophytophthora sp. Chile5]
MASAPSRRPPAPFPQHQRPLHYPAATGSNMQPQDPALDPAAFNYDSYQQYAHERSLHDQAIHHSMATSAASGAASASAKPAAKPASQQPTGSSSKRPKLSAGAASSASASVSDASPTSVTKSSDATAPGRNDALKSNRLCTMPGCKKRVRSKGLCKAHGGGRRCMVDGCERSSQGQGLCIRHGGGKRCTQPGCTKASQSNGLCKAHGGGLRCQSSGCTKSSQGGGFCRAHGGGQRCEKEGCNKGAQRGGFCAGHGGSRFCQHPDCTKNDRGGGFCAEHGGGKRCDNAGCNKPARKKGKCSYHANAAKGKLPKDALATAGPQHMMDMRQITTPTFAKEQRDAPIEQHRAVYAQQQRADLDMRFGAPAAMKNYEPSAAASQYLQIHADQRSYEPISLQAGGSARHYMPVDNALPPVSSSMYKNPNPNAGYGGRAVESMKNPYSQQWTTKAEMPQHHPDARSANLDYFEVSKEQQQAPGHHLPYPTQSAQYHHHLSAADSAAAAAAAYGSQQQQPRGYYSHQHPQASASGDQGAAQQQQQQQPNMMYYSANGYPSHQMHNLQQMQML